MDLIRRIAFPALVSALGLLLTACSTQHDTTPPPPPESGQTVLESELTHLAANYPGAVGVVRYRGKQDALAAHGVRRAGSGDTIQTSDRMHVGSLTKSMTAAMIASLVDAGTLHWDDHPAAVLGIDPAEVDAGYADSTLLDLLQHRSGMPSDDDLDTLPDLPGTPAEQRQTGAALLLAQPPAVARGTFRYSNSGYVVAAAMAEAATGQEWEDLIATRLLTPLSIQPIVGWPTTADKPDQPWGHVREGTKDWSGIDPASQPALVAVANPAGNLSMTLPELGRYLDLQLQGARGFPHLLSASAFTKLQTPVGSEGYACGLEVVDLGAEGRVLWHNGSNTTFYALMYIVPNYDLAVAIIINAGEAGTADVQTAVERVVRWYMDKGAIPPVTKG
jgi:CubicO group peptidase (beta-lactamase class C family)